MTLKLFFQLIFGVFSFNPKNMRWFNFKRVLIVLFLIPVFFLILLVNNLFLLLDYVFFPHFLWQKTKKPVFIISAPRSATTFLFHSLASNEKYTYFKLWEIIFAPSICQKFILVGILKFDAVIGKPLRKLVLFIENLFIGKLKKIHLIGLNLPEEDEAVLLWSLSSFYLNFFYPDSRFFDDLALFDAKISPSQKRRILRTYSRYVKRHNFVFNRRGEKQYLSKNPLMMSKVEGLSTIYPDAQLLNINRCPSKSFPSTLELNRALYGLFTSRPVPESLNKRSIQILTEWCRMCEENLNAHFQDQHLKIDFKKLVSQDTYELNRITDFLELNPSSLHSERKSTKKKHKSENKYASLSEKQLNEILEVLPFMKQFCDE